MARRNQHTLEEIKALVLSAAEAIVVEQGSSALTVRKIAIRIGYTVGSVYWVFDNMADVISHLNTQTVSDLTHHLQQTPIADLSALAQAYLIYVSDNQHRWRLWVETQIIENGRASASYQDAVDALINVIAKQFPDMDKPSQRNRLATIFWASMQGICSVLLTVQTDSLAEVECGLAMLARQFQEASFKQG